MNESTTILVGLKLFEKGTLKAFADVTIPSPVGELTIRGFRVIQKDGEKAWVGFPTNSYTKDGKTVHSQILETSRRLKDKLVEQILSEYKHKVQADPS